MATDSEPTVTVQVRVPVQYTTFEYPKAVWDTAVKHGHVDFLMDNDLSNFEPEVLVFDPYPPFGRINDW